MNKQNELLNNREMILLYKMKLILNNYSSILEQYKNLSNQKVDKRFLENRIWLNEDCSLKDDILTHFKNPTEENLEKTIGYYNKIKDTINSLDKKALLRRISTLESYFLVSTGKTKKTKNVDNELTSNRLSIITAVEMDCVRNSMQDFKGANINLKQESDFCEGDIYYLESNNEITNNIVSKNRDSEVSVCINRKLVDDELVSEESRHQCIKELKEYLENINSEIDVMWSILCDNYIKSFRDGTLDSEGKATLNFVDIHFKYKKRKGRNKGNYIAPETLLNYGKTILALNSFKAKIKLNSKSVASYLNFSKNKKTFNKNSVYTIDSNVINCNIIRERMEVKGLMQDVPISVKYNLDLLGKLYLTETKMVQDNYPTTPLLHDSNKLSAAINIYNKIYALSISSKTYKNAEYTLSDLIKIGKYTIDESRRKTNVTRFIENQLIRALEDAMADGLIKGYKISSIENIDFKYLENNIVKILF